MLSGLQRLLYILKGVNIKNAINLPTYLILMIPVLFHLFMGQIKPKMSRSISSDFYQIFQKNSKFSYCKNFRYEVHNFFCCSNLNRTRCRSLVMLYYLYTMRRWLSHSGVELPCLVFTTAQRCQSIYKVAILFSEKCEFTSHVYHFKNYQNNKI